MKTRALGQSGIQASVIGLGTWGMGGWQWGGEDEDQSITSIHAAIDLGMNLIDTAPIYGFGRSEEVVGKAIKGKRDKVVLATKCGLVCNTSEGEQFFRSNSLGGSEHGHIRVHKFLGAKSIREETEMSLKRLGTDHIDLMQTHWQEGTTPRSETMVELMKLKEEGKIRAIGVSNATSAEMEDYRKVGPLDSDQEKYSMIDRGIEGDQLPYCKEHNIAVFAYSSLALGVLAGKIDANTEFKPGDIRRGRPRYAKDNLQKIAAMLKRCKPVAEKHDLTMAQLVLAWTVAQPGLTHALVGARDPEHTKANAKAGEADLSAEDLKTLDDAVKAFDGV